MSMQNVFSGRDIADFLPHAEEPVLLSTWKSDWTSLNCPNCRSLPNFLFFSVLQYLANSLQMNFSNFSSSHLPWSHQELKLDCLSSYQDPVLPHSFVCSLGSEAALQAKAQ